MNLFERANEIVGVNYWGQLTANLWGGTAPCTQQSGGLQPPVPTASYASAFR